MGLTMSDGKVLNPEGLEINATFHCNMRCISCSHLAPMYRRTNADPATLSETLTVLANGYHASFVKILGGEPLLHPDLLGVIDAVRTSGVSDTIQVCTNGTLLDRADDALWEAVDALEVSAYPSRTPTEESMLRYKELAAQHDVRLTANYYENFRHAYSEEGTTSLPLVQEIFDTCKLAHVWMAHTVHEGWFYRCPQSMVLPDKLESDAWPAHTDAIRIEDTPDFAQRLMDFLQGSDPLRACQNCLGSVGKLHPHTEAPRATWRQLEPTEDLIDREYLEEVRQDIGSDDGCVQPAWSAALGIPGG